MAISDEQALELFSKLMSVCVDVSKLAHNYIGIHDLDIPSRWFYKYPRLLTDIYFDARFSEEKREKIPFLKYRIPKYSLSGTLNSNEYYPAVFEDTYSEDHIDLKSIKEIDDIKKWINSKEDILRCFTDKDELSDFVIREIVRDVVERYLFMTHATGTIPDDIEILIKPYLVEKICFYLEESLSFDICVPICLTTFEKEIVFDDGTKIVKISDELQKARQTACRYEVVSEDWVAACATHMIVLEGYSYQKNGQYSFNSVMQDYSCYPLARIDEIIGIIRVVTGYDIGYESIFCIPDMWVYETRADIVPIYGAKAHFVNSKYVTRDWMSLPVSLITEEQCDEIVNLLSNYQKNRDRLRFALTRLNRCLLRDEIDDMITDACIGLESLLAGNAHTEINNTIASRIPFVLSEVNDEKYPSKDGRLHMKKIYNLRSRIVHGNKLKENDEYCGEGEDKIYVPKMAVDYLRIVLWFMINNPNYIDAKEIDKYIDSLFQRVSKE